MSMYVLNVMHVYIHLVLWLLMFLWSKNDDFAKCVYFILIAEHSVFFFINFLLLLFSVVVVAVVVSRFAYILSCYVRFNGAIFIMKMFFC